MTSSASQQRTEYLSTAFVTSLCGHALLCYVMLVGFQRSRPSGEAVIYSVTLESGSTRGGTTQVPQTDKQTPVAPPKQISGQREEEQSKNERAETAKERVKAQDPVEDAEVSLAEQREKELQKQKEEQQRKAAEEKKRAEDKKKEQERKRAEERKKAEESKKQAAKQKAMTLAQIDRSYQQAMQRYLGASTDAGGQGFGGDGRGGRGMGGGIVKPPEWFIYKDKLESAVKQGWKWHQPNAALHAAVQFRISPSGVISDIGISKASGNQYFDESVLRAVAKASPVPAPPPQFYTDFSYVEIDFKPE